MTQLSKTLAASALAVALGFASVPAGAVGIFQEFTVDEGSVPGNASGTIVADKINGAYSETISFDGMGGFAASAFGNFSQFLENDGVDPVTSQLPGSYALYALFGATGTVAGGPAIFTFTGSAAAFSLFIDPDDDTTLTLPALGTGAVTVTDPGGDDYMIASASDLSSGQGILVAGVGGFFDLIFEDFALTSPEGTDYFVSPSPFYLRVNVDGDFDSFSVTGTQTVTGDLSAVFIPEPGTLALVGLALLGLGFGMRRKG